MMHLTVRAMKKITVTTTYYLLKPHDIQSDSYEYYYVRVENELMPENATWMQGYINHMGGVSMVGSPLSEELSAKLEEEFQEKLNEKTRDKCHYYDQAQGRDYCVNPVTSGKCDGVCKHFWTGIISEKL